jgi:hypothetical protein
MRAVKLRALRGGAIASTDSVAATAGRVRRAKGARRSRPAVDAGDATQGLTLADALHRIACQGLR